MISLVRMDALPQVWTAPGVSERCPARIPRKAYMSPLLTARPSVSVTLRLLAACAVTGVVAAFVPLAGGDGESSAAVPACLTVGIICAALVSHLLYASAKATDDSRLAWMSVG